VVGLVFGLILYITDRLLTLILPTQIINVFLVLLWVTLSGGLHLDGLADTADGLFGSREKNESLTIMRDSRIGVFGVIAVVSLILLKISLLGFLSGSIREASLLVAPALGRWTVPLIALLFSSAREEGLGKILSGSVGIFELALASASAVLVAVLFLKFKSLLVLVGAVFFAIVFGLLITRRIGGMTGDTFGASIELTEVWVLLMLLIL
jgi:adenosylcobinamide-GDP ribazoletransferase